MLAVQLKCLLMCFYLGNCLLKNRDVMYVAIKAIERGVVFEVCYSPMIRDSTARKNIISSVQSLATVSKGKVRSRFSTV